ncbi:MAG: helix-turn-helix domain-containing protein [Clostridia bacterium]|nr:helix-turn-helix domain-containing protein [Clostridia bacterium]
MANYELSNRIYELRTQKGLSQKELGAILGVSNKAVSKWETGTAIPKTETLIKLAEVFEISTEELLNMALPLQNTPTKEEGIILNPINARMGKTLGEFRAEQGLYLKDVAEKIGISEEELQTIEDSYLVPDEIANKLVVAYNLPENNFAKPVYKSKTVTKKYFLKIAFIYEIILALIGAIPSIISGILLALSVILDIYDLEQASTFVMDYSFLLTPIAATVGCILLGKYLTEKSGYIGDFNRYRFLYATIPVAASAAITSFAGLVIGLITDFMRDNPDGFLSVVYTVIISAVSLIFSLMGTVLITIVLSMLMGIAIEQNPERRKSFKTIAIIVTVSALLAFIIEQVSEYILFPPYVFTFHMDFLPYALNIVIVWLVYSITEISNPKKEKWAFKILPLLSIWGIMIELVIGLVGLGFEYLLEMLGEWMDSLIF